MNSNNSTQSVATINNIQFENRPINKNFSQHWKQRWNQEMRVPLDDVLLEHGTLWGFPQIWNSHNHKAWELINTKCWFHSEKTRWQLPLLRWNVWSLTVWSRTINFSDILWELFWVPIFCHCNWGIVWPWRKHRRVSLAAQQFAGEPSLRTDSLWMACHGIS